MMPQSARLGSRALQDKLKLPQNVQSCGSLIILLDYS
jgi:hypothetical protein